MIQVQKGKNEVLLSVVAKLDREDAFQLALDLLEWCKENEKPKAWVDNKPLPFQSAPSGIQFHNKEHYEAYLQDQSKKELSKEMQRSIEEAFGDKYTVTKEGKAIKKEKYDFLPSVTELEELKKQNNGKKRI